MIQDGRAGPTMIAAEVAQPTAEADRGRHPGFSSFDAVVGGPGSLALALV
jgi:hypothetical protein